MSVREIEQKLDTAFQDILAADGTPKWSELVHDWIRLYEGEYVTALHVANRLASQFYFIGTARAHIHHMLCRQLLGGALPVLPHPANR